MWESLGLSDDISVSLCFLYCCTATSCTRYTGRWWNIVYMLLKACPIYTLILLNESSYLQFGIAHSRGLPRSTFYISIKATSLWHFQTILTVSIRLRLFHCRQFNALTYFFIKHEHYNLSQIVYASMDFPLYCYSDHPKHHL